MKYILTLCVLTLLNKAIFADEINGPITGFIRTNLVGLPVIHERKLWIFDPDVAKKRSTSFIELNGDKGEKLIERLGLGIDGNEQKRLAEQRARDEGHLGGLNAFLP